MNLVCSKYSKVYDNFMLMGDFNDAVSAKAMEDFCSLNNLESLIKKTNMLQQSWESDMY